MATSVTSFVTSALPHHPGSGVTRAIVTLAVVRASPEPST